MAKNTLHITFPLLLDYVSDWRNSFQQSMAHGVICCHTDFGCRCCQYYDSQPLRILSAAFQIFVLGPAVCRICLFI